MDHSQRLMQARMVLAQAETKAGLLGSADQSLAHGWGVPSCLEPILPALGPGALVVESVAVMLGLAGQAIREGAWVATVGMPWIGWGAATQFGVDLTQCASVPSVRGRGADVLATLIDGFDLLLVGSIGVTRRDQHALAARARRRGVTLLCVEWDGVNVVRGTTHPGAGYSDGVGHLTSVRVGLQYGTRVGECLVTDRGLSSSNRLVAV